MSLSEKMPVLRLVGLLVCLGLALGAVCLRVFVPPFGTTVIWVASLLAIGIAAVAILRIPSPCPPGCCPNCFYNLTGNESGVCPECGTEVDRA